MGIARYSVRWTPQHLHRPLQPSSPTEAASEPPVNPHPDTTSRMRLANLVSWVVFCYPDVRWAIALHLHGGHLTARPIKPREGSARHLEAGLDVADVFPCENHRTLEGACSVEVSSAFFTCKVEGRSREGPRPRDVQTCTNPKVTTGSSRGEGTGHAAHDSQEERHQEPARHGYTNNQRIPQRVSELR